MDPTRYPGFMRLALEQAELAAEKGEVPVGAVVVFEEQVIGRGHNLMQSLHDATAHAEMVALSAAYEHFDDWRLENCYLFCSLEPCAMCAGAAVLSRIHTIVYGAADPKFGGCESIFRIPQEPRLNHRIDVVAGICETEAAALMQNFFRRVREAKERLH